MPEKDRGIGSEGLEQGGPSLGNDYTRNDLSVGNAGDAFTTPNTTELKKDDEDSLGIDQESNRNLTDEQDDDDDELEEEDFDDEEEDDEDLSDLDDDDEEDNELERGI